MKYPHIVLQFAGETWAILPEKYQAIRAFLRLAATGSIVAQSEFARIKAARLQPTAAPSGTIAVLPLFGTIMQRADLMTEYSGGTSTESYSKSFRAAMADPGVRAIVMQVDSPGGTVYGVPELADEIFAARGRKPIVAAVDSLAASAAYWIASAADEIVVTPSGEVGSIGVFAEHLDISKWLEQEGISPTLVSAGKYKVEGNQYQPLDQEAREAIQARVDQYYAMFVKSIARNRGATERQVREGYGEGRVVGAKDAVAMGMADRVGTIEDAIRRAEKLSSRGKAAAAELVDLELLSM